MLTVGARIKFEDCHECNLSLRDVTIDKVYVIAGFDWYGDPFFMDDVDEMNFAAHDDGYSDGIYTLVEVTH